MKVERGSKAKVVGVLAARDLQCHLLQGVADTLVTGLGGRPNEEERDICRIMM